MPGFEEGRYSVGEASYFVAEGGEGPPVLLLHGFPETHLGWEGVAPQLTAAFRVLAPDLRGYGASQAPPGGPLGEGYSKREMAAELWELMSALGHERFAVVGHDRGARVAYRLALDRPECVTRVVLVNVVPTVEQFARMGAGPSLGYWPWFLLAQPDEDARDDRGDVRGLSRKLPRRSRARTRRPRERAANRGAAAGGDRRGRGTARRRPARLAGVGPGSDRGPGSGG